MKKIIILTHTDLDGSVFPNFIQTISKKIETISNEKFDIEIKYADINDASKILKSDFEKFERQDEKELKNTYYLAMDIGNIGNAPEVNKWIEDMQAKGIKFSYIDHHASKNSDDMNENLECMYYSIDGSMSASMMGFVSVLDAINNKLDKNFIDNFDIKDDETKELFINNLENIKNSENKVHYQKKFFSQMLGLNEKNNIEIVKNTIEEYFQLIRATDLLDRRKKEEMKGLPVSTEYFNLSTEYSKEGLKEILTTMKLAFNHNEFEKIKKDVDEYKKIYNPEEKVKQSLESMEFIKVKGQSGKTYNIAVAFAESNIRYDVERKRLNMKKGLQEMGLDNINMDFLITATRYSIGNKTPIMTIKPCRIDGNAVAFANDVFKDKKMILGTNAGIPIEYSKDIYEKIAKSREQGKNDISKILEQIAKLFDFEKLEIERKPINFNRI